MKLRKTKDVEMPFLKNYSAHTTWQCNAQNSNGVPAAPEIELRLQRTGRHVRKPF